MQLVAVDIFSNTRLLRVGRLPDCSRFAVPLTTTISKTLSTMSAAFELTPNLMDKVVTYLSRADQQQLRRVKEAVDNHIIRRLAPLCIDYIYVDEVQKIGNTSYVNVSFSSFQDIFTKYFLMIAITRLCRERRIHWDMSHRIHVDDSGRNIVVFEFNWSAENLAEFLTSFITLPHGNTIMMHRVDLQSTSPVLITAFAKFFEGGLAESQIHEIPVGRISDAFCDATIDFINRLESECIQISPKKSVIPYDLLKRVADIKQWILIASYKLFSIESDALIALVVDLLNRKCSILDVSDILTIASEDAELLVQHILHMNKKVYFAAAIDSQADMRTRFGSKLEVEIRDGECRAMKLIVIKHIDIERDYASEHSH